MRSERSAAGQGSFADGVYLTTTCAESFALMPYEAAAKAARATVFGDYRLRRQHDACSHWPAVQVAPGLLRLSASAAPVLIVSGARDPVAPPAWGAELARSLANARQVVVEHGAHVIEGLTGLDTCYDPMVQRFFETAKLDGVDTSCVADMRAPAFKVP
jgi:pimeloyl-ACP methyl ester carboxylesterase